MVLNREKASKAIRRYMLFYIYRHLTRRLVTLSYVLLLSCVFTTRMLWEEINCDLQTESE